MKSVFKLEELRGKVESAIANNERGNDKSIAEWEAECIKVNEYNSATKIEAEKVFHQHGNEGLISLCVEQSERSYIKNGWLFNREVSYITDKINHSNIPFPLQVTETDNTYWKSGIVRLAEFQIKTQYPNYFNTGLRQGSMSYTIFYEVEELPEFNRDWSGTNPKLLALQDKVNYLLKSGATEVILDDNEIQLLTKWSR